ncbi:helix-turn-helix domain-containing protein [Cellvibrio sp. OA-2007]|uniref:helix-turn-helix domain-containing protein n=1 Tax=Cellvibrio sp. OA-2007 TaxID=529823 RepID=UPI00078355A2|nr:helix-turn-helix transcriptional regulator [Cellvibrio sp. OA-2007]
MKSSPYSPHYEKLRLWLKKQREASGLTLREASLAMGRHHSVLGKMEQDRRKIEVLEFVRYCQVLGVDPHEGLDILIYSLQDENNTPQ